MMANSWTISWDRRGCESIRTLYRTKPCRGNPRIWAKWKGQGRCEAALPREKKMPSMSETNGMENMLGTTQKESTEGRRSKGSIYLSVLLRTTLQSNRLQSFQVPTSLWASVDTGTNLKCLTPHTLDAHFENKITHHFGHTPQPPCTWRRATTPLGFIWYVVAPCYVRNAPEAMHEFAPEVMHESATQARPLPTRQLPEPTHVPTCPNHSPG